MSICFNYRNGYHARYILCKPRINNNYSTIRLSSSGLNLGNMFNVLLNGLIST